MKKLFVLTIFLLISHSTFSQDLTVIEEDFEKATVLAKQENKLLFIDFYTIWCGPCKKLDKYIFQNDSIRKIMAKDFILLKYDAEKDSIFNISKRYHLNSYPTAIILNSEGFVLNRKYGFAGEEFEELNKSFAEYIEQSLKLNKENKIIKGFSNKKVNVHSYPQFYIDYVNRTNTKINETKEFEKYLEQNPDRMSQEFFSVVTYFAMNVPSSLTDEYLNSKNTYIEMYGEGSVELALYFMSIGKFETSIDQKNEKMFEEAKQFIIKALGKDDAQNLIAMFEEKFEEVKEE